MSTTKVAVLGTGLMGAPIAGNLAEQGFDVRVWNRTRARAEPLLHRGATLCLTPAEAVRGSDIVITILSDGATVSDVMTDAADGLSPDAVWIQSSTVGVHATEDHIELARSFGLGFVDAPVLGSTKPAIEGKLIILASGSDDLRHAVQPVFDVIGARTMWVGEAGCGTKLKLAANSWILSLTAAVGEALSLAEGLNIDPQLFLDAVTGGPTDCGYLQLKAKAILDRNLAPAFTVANAAKDASLVGEAAVLAGVQLDAASAAGARLNRAITQGHGDEDMAAAYFASWR
ncbi:dehydrogenase [Lentzea sp. NBRC 105346]|uniref:NAD(P)-dependent oxidoreductase n=1 Tax=Lentzea sp. NBRC 105346 TaxID=3032205 RepID=UPI0024A05B74|nr:NAD(P)-dependent oxidoreductase [Lentzea sp. NBRC 105346]GLZ33174.1 dehydrogenase [Lentzea sp. NBRC 105346]